VGIKKTYLNIKVMSEFKGTKGKWEFRDGYAMDIVTSDSRSFRIFNLGTEKEAFLADYPLVELKSNAKLIATAPEMLEMLELYATLNANHYKEFSGFILKTRELIKKATS